MRRSTPRKGQVVFVTHGGRWGGTVAIESLCYELQKIGVKARLFYNHGLSDPYTPLLTKCYVYWPKWIIFYLKWHYYKCLLKIVPEASRSEKLREWNKKVVPNVPGVRISFCPFFLKKRTVVVYPEKYYGNVLNAKYVVRWLLYYYPYSTIRQAYADSDLFICYRLLFNDWQLNPKGYQVKMNFFNKDLYRRYNWGARTGNCYIIHKGRTRQDLPEAFDGPVVDDLSEEEKVKVFNRCDYCYSYDTQTFYSNIAAICGCKSVVVLEPGKTKEDYLGQGERCAGVAYGTSEACIQQAQDEYDELVQSVDYAASNRFNAHQFIEIIRTEFSIELL